MSENLTIRPATHGQAWEDMLLGDTWTLHRLGIDRTTAIKNAGRHWGPPAPSMLPGERLWRLRVGELPVYVSVCPEEASPIVMFNSFCCPDDDLERAILERVETMLSDEGSST